MSTSRKHKLRAKSPFVTLYVESYTLPPGILPTKKNVECMMYLMRKDRAGKQQRTVTDGANLLAVALQSHWQYCNIYTLHLKNIEKHITKLYTEFKDNVQYRKKKQTDLWKAKMVDFNRNMLQLFDIFCEDSVARAKWKQNMVLKWERWNIGFLKT